MTDDNTLGSPAEDRVLNQWEGDWDRPEALDDVSVYGLMRELHDRLQTQYEAEVADGTMPAGLPRTNAFMMTTHTLRTGMQSVRAEGAGFTYDDLELDAPVVEDDNDGD